MKTHTTATWHMHGGGTHELLWDWVWGSPLLKPQDAPERYNRTNTTYTQRRHARVADGVGVPVAAVTRALLTRHTTHAQDQSCSCTHALPWACQSEWLRAVGSITAGHITR